MASGKLVFQHPSTGSARLVLGEGQGGSVTQDAHLSVQAPLAGESMAQLLWRRAQAMAVDAALADDDAAELGLLWDAGVSRGLRGPLQLPWQAAQRAAPAAVRQHWQSSDPLRLPLIARWQVAQPLALGLRAHWQSSETLHLGVRTHWQAAVGVRAGVRQGWQSGDPLRHAVRSRWQEAARLHAGLHTLWQENLRLRHALRSHWQEADSLRGGLRFPFSQALARHIAVRSHWQEAMRPPAGVSPIWRPAPPPPPLCYDPDRLGLLVFEEPFTGDGRLVFICRSSTAAPLPPARIAVPVRRVYFVLNQIELIRMDGNLPLPAYALSLSLDADSWTWQWSASLHQDALPHLAPARQGDPVEVQATINSVPYRLLVESVRRDREFASTRIHVSGRGLAATLDAPYAPSLPFTNDTGRSAHQLMLDALSVNGVSSGWNVDWQLTDWLVPAGAWSHQGSALSALVTIAQAAGGYLQPHPTERTLRVLPRYPVAPWHWASLTPDVELPMDPISVEAVEWTSKAAYNRVWVSGAGATGVLAQVTREATAGDLHAPMVVDPLITHADAASQRARAILSDTGVQTMVRMTLPVLPDTGLILPGQFLRRVDGAEVLQGYVRGMSLTWDSPRLRQSLEVQTHA